MWSSRTLRESVVGLFAIVAMKRGRGGGILSSLRESVAGLCEGALCGGSADWWLWHRGREWAKVSWCVRIELRRVGVCGNICWFVCASVCKMSELTT